MNKKGAMGKGLRAAFGIIALVVFLLIFTLLFKWGVEPNEAEIKSAEVSQKSDLVLSRLLKEEVVYNKNKVSIADLVILSVKDKNYDFLKSELEKRLNLPDLCWHFAIYKGEVEHENELLIAQRKDWTFDKVDTKGETLAEINLVTNLLKYPKLIIVFSIREGHEIGTRAGDTEAAV